MGGRMLTILTMYNTYFSENTKVSNWSMKTTHTSCANTLCSWICLKCLRYSWTYILCWRTWNLWFLNWLLETF